MSSFFSLLLDTTAPDLKMYIPTYAQFGEEVEFIVESDEKLDAYRQNAYVMFGKERYDIVLSYNEEKNEYVGLFKTNAFVAPSCTVFVEVFDDVGNKGVISSGVEIYSNKQLTLDYEVDIRRISYECVVKNRFYRDDSFGGVF